MDLLAHARIVMWQGGALWVVDATPPSTPALRRTDLHAHHAIQMTMSLGGTFRIDTPKSHIDGYAVAVAPDIPHTFEAEGLVALLFVEPESREGRAIAAQLFDGRDLTAIPTELLADFATRIASANRMPRDDSAFADIGRAAIARMFGVPPGALRIS